MRPPFLARVRRRALFAGGIVVLVLVLLALATQDKSVSVPLARPVSARERRVAGYQPSGSEPTVLSRLDHRLSMGDADSQNEDPTALVARDGSLYVVFYSNRNGPQPDGQAGAELFIVRSTDGITWTDPPVQVAPRDGASFGPSLAQSPDGEFHLAWWRRVPMPHGCSLGGAHACTGAEYRIVYKSSRDGLGWDKKAGRTITKGPGDLMPSVVYDTVKRRLLVFFVSSTRDEDGSIDRGNTTSYLYVVGKHGTTFGTPTRVEGLGENDSSQDSYPFVVQRPDGTFLMTWTRFARSASVDPTRLIDDPSTETLVATSRDAIHWSSPIGISNAPNAIDVFPAISADEDGKSFSVIWMTAAPRQRGHTVEARLVGDAAEAPRPRDEIPGYSPRMLATGTPGVYFGVGVIGEAGHQQIACRLFDKP